MPAASKYLIVGIVRKPHGIRGELSVALETDHPDVVFRRGRTLEIGDASGRPTGTSVTVERSRPFKGGVILKVSEYGRLTEEVEGLRGKTFLIPAEAAAPLGEDEVYYHDLIGMTVRVEGEIIGEVREVMETPGADLLVIRRKGAGDLLVPFVREMVSRLDLEGRVLEIEVPEGLLEL